MTKWEEIYHKFLQGNFNQLVTGQSEDGLHAHIKQERSSWVVKAIQFTVEEMEKKKK